MSLSEEVTIDGIPATLLDTAGIAETADPVEMLGIARARRALAAAGAVVLVLDGSCPARPGRPRRRPRDLPRAPRTAPAPCRSSSPSPSATSSERAAQDDALAPPPRRPRGRDLLRHRRRHPRPRSRPRRPAPRRIRRQRPPRPDHRPPSRRPRPRPGAHPRRPRRLRRRHPHRPSRHRRPRRPPRRRRSHRRGGRRGGHRRRSSAGSVSGSNQQFARGPKVANRSDLKSPRANDPTDAAVPGAHHRSIPVHLAPQSPMPLSTFLATRSMGRP